MDLTFDTTIIEWRGPAPFFFAPIPAALVADVRRAAKVASYGWGVVPVTAAINRVRFTTSLFPKNEGYLLPIKVDVRRRAKLTLGDSVSVAMTIESRGQNPFDR